MSQTHLLNRLIKQRVLLKQRCDELLETDLFGLDIDKAMEALHDASDEVKDVQKEIDAFFGRFEQELMALLALLAEIPKAISKKIAPYRGNCVCKLYT